MISYWGVDHGDDISKAFPGGLKMPKFMGAKKAVPRKPIGSTAPDYDFGPGRGPMPHLSQIGRSKGPAGSQPLSHKARQGQAQLKWLDSQAARENAHHRTSMAAERAGIDRVKRPKTY